MIQHAFRRIITRQRPHLVFALRGTVAVLVAVAAAAFLRLENPYWAGMTALIVIQPTRGLLLEKSYYRLLGTAAGSVAGYLLLLSTKDPFWITIGLSLWIAVCVGLGNLLYGLRSYACLMAGCTGVVVAMSISQHPSHLYDIAFGRVAGITVGIIVSTAVSFFFASNHSGHKLADRLRELAAEAVSWLALLLRPGGEPNLLRREQDIIIDLASIEELVDVAWAGSPVLKKRKRDVRSLIVSLLSLLAVGRLAREHSARWREEERSGRYWRDQFAWKLEEVAYRLETSSTVNCTSEMEAIAAEAAVHLPLLGETLRGIISSLQNVLAEWHPTLDTCEGGIGRFIRHRDWEEAGRAATRAAVTLAAVGLTWWATGWSKGPLMLMAMSIMLSIFSVKEHPAFFVGQIFIGAAAGSATAVLCRIVLLTGVTDTFSTIAVIAPFILLGVFCMSRRATAIAATDATLFFLFVSQPGMSIAVIPVDLAIGAVAMVMGVGGAWLSYRFLVPIDPAIRLRSLMDSILRDLKSIAGEESPERVEKATARLHHRVIRLVAMATRHDADHRRLVTAGIAALAVTDTLKRLQAALSREDLPPSKAIAISEVLVALFELSRERGDVTPVLEKAAAALYEISEPASSPVPRDGSAFAGGMRGWDGGGVRCPI